MILPLKIIWWENIMSLDVGLQQRKEQWRGKNKDNINLWSNLYLDRTKGVNIGIDIHSPL
jgi:hypothetical protein